ncbi:MAG: 6-phosphogluconolactonase [Pseudomonadota bacterium]
MTGPQSSLETYADRAALMEGLAGLVAAQLRETLATKGEATLAVPGGTTPGPFLRLLGQTALDWSRVRVMLTDERFVPESSERSNTRLLRETLLQGPAAEAELVPFYAEAARAEDVLDDLTAAVVRALPLDICVLGMGADMHTASLFPGADRLGEALSPSAPPLLPMRAAGAAEPRITLTAPILATATHIHLLITGEEKRDAHARALAAGAVEDAPVRCVLTAPSPARVHYAD